jgi:hypothetical protein
LAVGLFMLNHIFVSRCRKTSPFRISVVSFETNIFHIIIGVTLLFVLDRLMCMEVFILVLVLGILNDIPLLRCPSHRGVIAR